MSIASNNLLSWSDIENIFINLNTQRERFNIDTVTVPANRNTLAKANLADTIKDYIEDLSTNPYVGTTATISDEIPTVGELIEPLIFTRFSNVITRISEVCEYNSSFYTTNNSHRGSFYTTNNSHRGSFFTSNDSYRGSFFTSDNSHRGSFFTSNNGHRSSNNGFNPYTSWCSSFRGSNNGFTARTSNNSWDGTFTTVRHTF